MLNINEKIKQIYDPLDKGYEPFLFSMEDSALLCDEYGDPIEAVAMIKNYDQVMIQASKVTDDSDFYTPELTTTTAGYASNIIQLIIDAANCLKGHDKEGAARYADAVYAAQTTLSLYIADLGNKSEFIDFNLNRLTNNKYTLQEQQNDYEATDLATETTTWKMIESIYNSSLQMSASVIPMSIFNFMS